MGWIFDILFGSLTMLLIFSTGIIIYSSLFASQESAFLLTTPVPDDHVFSYKLQGAIAFSSWAFVLLGSPVLIAYGMVVKGGASWPYYPSLVLFFLGFILIPGTVGALLTLIIVNIVPRDRKQLLLGRRFRGAGAAGLDRLALDRQRAAVAAGHARLVLGHRQ